MPSIRVVLYPTTVIKNNHMIRLPGMRHVFINHGDGDKSVTYSPLHRVFDEIWVAGQAGCDRYLNRGEGIRAAQLHRVGRPQLAHIERLAEVPTHLGHRALRPDLGGQLLRCRLLARWPRWASASSTCSPTPRSG